MLDTGLSSMSARTILSLYLVVFLLELVGDAVLVVLHLRRVKNQSGSVPQAFAGVVDLSTHARSASYTLARGRLALAAGAVSAAAVLAAVLTGFLGLVDQAVRALPLHPALQGVLFIACLSALSWAIGLPFSLCATFSIEARFGFNRTTPGLFILDTLKGLALSAVIGVPVLFGLFLLMEGSGRLWWLWAFSALSALQILMTVFFPLVIAPLFNRFTPLPAGALRDAILDLAGRLHFRVSGVFVMDGSRRSRHSNAYFTGLGRAKRIVLFDTLVASSPQEEILAVLAHEIGHDRRRHLPARIAVSLAVSLAGFWVAGLLLHWQPLFSAFGIEAPSPHGLAALLAFFSRPLTFFLAPLSSMWSRRHEYQADRFAVEAMGSAEGMKAALLRLTRDNLSTLTPHPLYSFFNFSHPTLAERISALEAHAALQRQPHG